MKPPIIALESANLPALEVQANNLEITLNKAGLSVAVIRFPQLKSGSTYFIKEYKKGSYQNTNPYITATFFALDKFDSQNLIKNALAYKDVVILVNYLGGGLMYEASRFGALDQQKAFLIWLDSFESQMYGNIRPKQSFVLRFKNDKNEINKQYSNLCQFFPKDYSLIELDNPQDSKLINELKAVLVKNTTTSVDANEATNKYQKRQTASLLDVIKSQKHLSNIKVTHEYIEIPSLNKHQTEILKSGLGSLNQIRNKILKNTPADRKPFTDELLSVLCSRVTYHGENLEKFRSHAGEFENVLHDSLTPSKTKAIKISTELIDLAPKNQLTIANDIIFAVTELNQQHIIEQTNKMPYNKKSELIRAYIKDGHKTGLNNIYYTLNVGASLFDVFWLKRTLQKETITVQRPSPENGYNLPKWAQKDSTLYAEYFDYLTELNIKLSNTEASRYLIALGNIVSAKIKLNYHEIMVLNNTKNAPQIAHDIVMQAKLAHPIIFE